jgi:O-antigen ligase
MIGEREALSTLRASPVWPIKRSLQTDTYLLAPTAAWTAMGVALYAISPMAAPAVLGLAVLAPLAWCWAVDGQLPWQMPSAPICALLVAGLYALINASWSMSPGQALATAALILAGAGAIHVTLANLSRMPASALRAMGFGLLIGLACAAAVICFELLTAQWLRRALATYYGGLRPTARDMHVVGGQLLYFQPYLLNRSVAALGLMFWPALLVFPQLAMATWQRRTLTAGLLLTPAALLLSSHATAKMAFAGAAAAYGIARVSPPFAKRLLTAGWIVATLLAAPITGLAYSNNLHLAGWLEFSARHRIVIWEYTRNEVAKAPVFGAGIDTTRALHKPDSKGVPRVPGTDFPDAMPLHTHNAYLQVWHETGAVGAVLALVLGVLVLRAIAGMQVALQPHFYAMFAGSALLVASSFSIWATWLLSGLMLTPLLAGVGAALCAIRARTP